MRERGLKHAVWAGLGVGSFALLSGAIVAASGSSSFEQSRTWARTLGEFVISPAHADRGRRRSGNNDNTADKDKAKSGQLDAARQARLLMQQAEAAKRAQDAAATQARVQAIQQMVANQQKRLQEMQAHRRQPHQPAAAVKMPSMVPAAATAPPRITAVTRHQAMVEQMTAKLRHRQQVPQQATSHPASPGNRHQALLNQVTARLRQNHSVPAFRSPAARFDNNHGRGSFGGHQSALLKAMDRIRSRRDSPRDFGRNNHGRFESRQHAVFSHIAQKLSRHGHRWSRQAKAEPTPTPAPATTTPTVTTTPQVKKTQTVTNGLIPDAPDVTKVAATITSKLPEVASNNSNSSSKSESNSDNTMSRLGGPKQEDADDDRRSSRVRTQKKDDADNDGTAKPASRDIGRRMAGELLPPPGTFKQNEVLAVNITPESLAKALKRDFKVVDKIEFPALGRTITRLATPSSLNAVIGRSTLQEELPTEGFVLNHIYVGGSVAASAQVTAPVPAPAPATSPVPSGAENGGVKTAAAVTSPPPGINSERRGAGCLTDRCFGVGVINWQPQLAACAQGVKVGVIDTGVDRSHPAFAGYRFEHHDFTPANSKKPSNQHGTGIFSLLAGNPRSSTPGLIPEAKFFVGDAFFADRNGNAMSDTITMMKALNWLKLSGVDVANLSFAGPRDELVQEAIQNLARSGTVILAAAGNDGQDEPSYPAAYPEVIAVTAVDRNLAPYVYANRGSHIAVAAPGVDVWTALPNRKEGPQTGTSFAVPFVTSVVALSYRSEDRVGRGDPLAPKRQALALLQKNIKAIGGRDRAAIFGAGLVQAPAHCDPRIPAATVASAKTNGNGWGGTVEVVPAAARAIQPPSAAAWTTTLHPVAGRK